MRGQRTLKGVARRVVIVRSPPDSVFEQAIFIVREDARSGGVTSEQVLTEARRAAGAYAASPSPKPQPWKPWAFLAVSVAALILALVIILM